MKTPAVATDTNRLKGKKKMHCGSSTRTTIAQSYKGKEKVDESIGRPPRNKKPLIKEFGLYTNLKIRQQTYYVS